MHPYGFAKIRARARQAKRIHRRARRIQAQGSRTARWIAADALRELTGDAVQARLKARR